MVLSLTAPALSRDSPDEAKLSRAYERVNVNYVHVALPARHALERSELPRWIAILGMSEEQSSEIRALYDEYVQKGHNATLDQMMPPYLELSAEAAAKLEAHGWGSEEFGLAFTAVERRGAQVLEAVESAELQFVDAIALYLARGREAAPSPAEIEGLGVLRGFASRRRSRAIVSMNR